MNPIKKLIKKSPLSLRIHARELSGYTTPYKYVQLKKNLKIHYRAFEESKEKGIGFKDGLKTWHKSFRKFLRAQPSESEVAFEFFNSKISLIKLSEKKYDDKEVILLCIVKNDILKIKKLLEHHRKIGITHFAILDNDSTDGTKEWLKLQPDVDLFEVEDKYTTNRREAWINRLIAYLGINRWYLIVDSDEFFMYFNMEEHKISSLIKYCEEKSIYRLRGLMVDMYAKDSFYQSNEDCDYLENCKYFDLYSYHDQERDFLDLVTGGPRARIFNQNPWLTKYPLCFFMEGDIQGKSHYLFPYRNNKNTECFVALLHYKFLPSDILKYRQISEEGNYFNGSKEYKDYVRVLEESSGLSFINELQTQEYINSESLYEIPMLKKIILE